jgi:hypothetical protein
VLRRLLSPLQPACAPAARALTVAAGGSGSRWQHSPARPCGRPPPHWSSPVLAGYPDPNSAYTLGDTTAVLKPKPEELSVVLKHLGSLSLSLFLNNVPPSFHSWLPMSLDIKSLHLL